MSETAVNPKKSGKRGNTEKKKSPTEESKSAKLHRFNLKLIPLVEEHQVLYDTSHKEYKNTKFKHDIWRDISAGVEIPGIDAIECMERWKLLRARYCKELSAIKNTSSGSRGSAIFSRWKLFAEMAFLEPYIEQKTKHMSSNSNITNHTVETLYSDDENSNIDEPEEFILDPETGDMVKTVELYPIQSKKPKLDSKKPADLHAQGIDKLSNAFALLTEELRKEPEEKNLGGFGIVVDDELQKVRAEFILDCKIAILSTLRDFQNK